MRCCSCHTPANPSGNKTSSSQFFELLDVHFKFRREKTGGAASNTMPLYNAA